MRILISILILFNSLASFTQELEVSVNKNPALTNEMIQLQFSINAKGDDFIPPSLENFHILNGPSQGFSQSYSNINGKTTKEIKTTISYNIQAKKEGKYIIGPASVQINNKTIKSKNVEIVVEKSTLPVKTANTIKTILENSGNGVNFQILSNPEFFHPNESKNSFSPRVLYSRSFSKLTKDHLLIISEIDSSRL